MQKPVSLMLYSALVAAPLGAQEPAPAPSGIGDIYIPAEPLNRSAPTYPASSLSSRREGWVLVSFIISEEGEVIEPMIEDSSNPDFDAPTLRAIRKWRYKPATVDGTPVEQSMVQTMIRYKLADAKGASSSFVKKYRAAYALIAAKNVAEAAPLVQELEKGEQNYYETAWFWWLKYAYLDTMGTAQPEALMQALDKALGSSETEDDAYLQPDVFVAASQRLYAMRARSGDLSGALAVYERLKASNTAKRSKLYKDVVASLEPSHSEILSLVAGPRVLRQTARVDEHNYWVHRMLRRSFALADVRNGKLDVVDVRCSRANRRFVSLPENAVLKIPDTWGDCGVYVKGDEGTTFAFEEYPAGYADAADPAQLAPAN
jgi:TonB family protein